MARIMAFDVGLKRIGVAVTDELQIIATAAGTQSPDEINVYIDNYLKQNIVEIFVVGMPLNTDGSDTDGTVFAKQFANWLNKTYSGIKVFFEDERFTSHIAKQSMFESGLSKKQRADKKSVDTISAVLILQNFLERKKNNFIQ